MLCSGCILDVDSMCFEPFHSRKMQSTYDIIDLYPHVKSNFRHNGCQFVWVYTIGRSLSLAMVCPPMPQAQDRERT